jgi:CDP-glycerol glycerophosphotransferase
VIDYAPTAPGPHVATTRDVVRLVGRLDQVAAEYADARARFRKEYTDLDDGHAAARLVDAVFVPRGDAPAS